MRYVLILGLLIAGSASAQAATLYRHDAGQGVVISPRSPKVSTPFPVGPKRPGRRSVTTTSPVTTIRRSLVAEGRCLFSSGDQRALRNRIASRENFACLDLGSFCARKRVKGLRGSRANETSDIGVKPFPRNHEVAAKSAAVNRRALHFALIRQPQTLFLEQIRCVLF
jgi:hypothetical protein